MSRLFARFFTWDERSLSRQQHIGRGQAGGTEFQSYKIGLSTVTIGLPPVFAENLKKNLRLLGKEEWRLAQT